MLNTDTDRTANKSPVMGIGGDDWPTILADNVVNVVENIRSRTVDNVLLAAKAFVYGLVAIAVLIVCTILIVILMIRITDAYLPIGDGVGSGTWAAYAFTGTLTGVLGMGFWFARYSSAKPIWVALMVDTALIVGVIAYGLSGLSA